MKTPSSCYNSIITTKKEPGDVLNEKFTRLGWVRVKRAMNLLASEINKIASVMFPMHNTRIDKMPVSIHQANQLSKPSLVSAKNITAE